MTLKIRSMLLKPDAVKIILYIHNTTQFEKSIDCIIYFLFIAHTKYNSEIVTYFHSL